MEADGKGPGGAPGEGERASAEARRPFKKVSGLMAISAGRQRARQRRAEGPCMEASEAEQRIAGDKAVDERCHHAM